MAITIEQEFFEILETGRYPAKIAKIEEEDGQYGLRLKFTFELPPGEDGKARKLYGWASRKFSNKSKLYDWTKAVFGGGPIDRSYPFNSDDLLGKYVYVVVTEEEGEKGPVNKIQNLLPYRQPEQQPAPQSW